MDVTDVTTPATTAKPPPDYVKQSGAALNGVDIATIVVYFVLVLAVGFYVRCSRCCNTITFIYLL